MLARNPMLPVAGTLLLATLLFGGVVRAEEPQTAPAQELLHPATAPAKVVSFDPTSTYDVQQIEGWTIRVNQQLLREQPDLATRTLKLLDAHLFQITREVPQPALNHMQKVVIWVEHHDRLVPCMCYHADLGWVREHGLNPEKAKGVELGNPQTFLDWTHAQPWMVFHELAHAYHDQSLPGGFENADVANAYRAAKDSRKYEDILYVDGRRTRHYALTNPMEYFAETSEAYFGTNDFYPFVRGELLQFDPRGYALMKQSWRTDHDASVASAVSAATGPSTAPASATATLPATQPDTRK